MKHLVKFPLEDGGSIMVEVDELEPEGGIVKAGRPGDALSEAKQTFESALDNIQPISLALISKLRGMANPPDGIEVEFGINMSAQAGVIISNVSATANFKVTLNWRRDETSSKRT